MSARASLGGIPLSAMASIGWKLTTGVRPYQCVFETSIAFADKILANGSKSMTLVIASPGHPTLRFSGLYVIASVPGRFRWSRGVLVTDSRYFWNRTLIVADMNKRRKTGDTRLVGEGRIENRAVVPTIAYAPWSLHNGSKPWRAYDALSWVANQIDPTKPDNIKIPPIKREVVIEDLYLNDPGDFALEKLLAYVGGYNVRPNPDGSYSIYDTLSRDEVEMINNAGAAIAWRGYRGAVDRSYSRPARVKCYAERETELRFDYEEGEVGSRDVPRNERVKRRLENVMPCPDPTLQLAIADGAATVANGTILTVDAVLRALSGLQANGSIPPLDRAMLLLNYIGVNWEMLQTLYCYSADGLVFDPNWARRLREIRHHFRLTFRPLPEWRDKIRTIRAYRVAIIDPTTGTRARSQAYMDYVSFPTEHGIWKHANQNPDIGFKVLGFPTDGFPGTLAKGKAAPAEVTLVDADQSIMHISFKRDPYGESEGFAPGRVDVLPTLSVSAARAKGNYLLTTLRAAQVSNVYRVAIVVTAVQATPNGLGRYQEFIVEPKDAEKTLGQPIGTCNGPEMKVFIGSRAAMVAWNDARASEIENAFYDGSPMPLELVVNRDEMKNLAEAEAARIYASFLDRVEGSFSVAINPSIVPVGSISEVEHTIEPDGGCYTRIVLSPQIQPPPAQAFTSPVVQKAVRFLVQVQ